MSRKSVRARKKTKKELLHSADVVRRKLKIKQLYAEKSLSDKHPQAFSFLAKKNILSDNLRKHSASVLGAGIVAGALFLTPHKSGSNLPALGDLFNTSNKVIKGEKESFVSSATLLSNNLASILPSRTRPLHRNEEKLLEQVLTQSTGVKVRASLEGEHLNTSYGRIGIEQHLRRYPGDTIADHGTLKEQREGVASGLGAWGYFAPSKTKLTSDLAETEKWYAVVQTLYLHDWNTRQPYMKNWYKYRKIMIVNTKNGNAVIASIADSGPAAWTGKHYGGSPEVMQYLGSGSGKRYTKGPVLVFFVDDPDNKVPLGPVEYDKVDLGGNTLAMSV